MVQMILISNPGSASRKYALYSDGECLLKIHFEHEGSKIVYGLERKDQKSGPHDGGINHLTFAASKIESILTQLGLIGTEYKLETIAIRVVAPSKFFQRHRKLDENNQKLLHQLEARAPLHINIVLQEIAIFKSSFPGVGMVGVSDSAFHSTLPEYAASYGLPADKAQKLEIKRYGYHGLSVESVVDQLKELNKLPTRLVVCHLGSGASVTAVKNGESVDTTMGYSPLEGLMMATRSGDLDVTAAQVLQDELKLSSDQLQAMLNHDSGLLGVSGKSSDVRELLVLEKGKNEQATLAIKMFVYKAQQGIAQMASALGGIDTMVFSGTVGERSAEIRKRILHGLKFLGVELDAQANHEYDWDSPRLISPTHHPAKVYVVPTDESSIMAKHAIELLR